jgi:hypothetical protein
VAQQVNVKYVDDLDGSAASGPVDFSLDGKTYTIDLSDTNASKLRGILAPFVDAARRARGSTSRSGGASAHPGAPHRSRDETQAMRSWLRDKGYTVKDRGRIPAELITAYETRTPATPAPDRSTTSKSRKRRKVNNVEFSGGGAE